MDQLEEKGNGFLVGRDLTASLVLTQTCSAMSEAHP